MKGEIVLKIKLRRISKGLTQKELANKVGISHVTLSKFENGSYENITLRTMLKLAAALDTTVHELFFSDEE
ncbi:helix-turn-helix transcriptional regulator [Clostridium perfringens]|uniref:helix-turn-helix transcriptional regulator n=1 Tax=Clostridium perfringens TaxID=1502 RepID=UPI0019D2842A|nr:helix-turn-helix transcriptional regulator [Clostridium perfringens]MDY4421430.1 helix-turn-helix transcriptional regulator [Clostridium perfringens]